VVWTVGRDQRLKLAFRAPFAPGQISPTPPLHFSASMNGRPYDFSTELAAIASTKGAKSILRAIEDRANKRNRVLYSHRPVPREAGLCAAGAQRLPEDSPAPEAGGPVQVVPSHREPDPLALRADQAGAPRPRDQPGARAVEAGAPRVLPQDGHRE